jgi:hypothetical protein
MGHVVRLAISLFTRGIRFCTAPNIGLIVIGDPSHHRLAAVKNRAQYGSGNKGRGSLMVRFSIEARGRVVDISYEAAPDGVTVWIASITGHGAGRTLDGVLFSDCCPRAETQARVLIAVLNGVDWFCSRLF